MTKTRVLASAIATVAVGAVIAGGVMFGVNLHNAQVARQLEQERHAQAVATWSAIEANTVHTSGAAVDQAATVAGDQEAAQIAAQQAAEAAAAQSAAQAAQQQAQQAAAQKTTTTKKTTTTATKTTTRSTTNTTTTDPQPPAPIRCPAGSQAVSGDAGNDTACLPAICFQIVLPDANHPECDTPFKP